MSDYPGAAWLARYRERVNGDAELKVIGDWFTTTFGLTFGDTRYAVRVEKGQITDIVTPTGGRRGEAAVGATWQLNPAVGVYGELGQLWASGGSTQTRGGPNASVGLSLRW